MRAQFLVQSYSAVTCLQDLIQVFVAPVGKYLSGPDFLYQAAVTH